jgi:arylsulfatase A-like enzyme
MLKNYPNIVWFITDDTSDEMLGYAGGNVLTPHIDSIARDGVVCTQYHTTSPACCASRYSYLTGLYPGHCPDSRFADAFPEGEPYSVGFNVYTEPSTPTIANLLQNAGYRTGFTGKWHVGSSRDSLTGNTYSEDDDPQDPEVVRKLMEDYRTMQEEVRSTGFQYADSIAWANTDNRTIKKLRYHNLEWHVMGALEFLDSCEGSDKPFFLNMATTTIHGPHHVESLKQEGCEVEWGMLPEVPDVMPSRQSVLDRLADAGIEVTHRSAGALWMDDAFGAVMKRVEEMGVADNTIFIWSTDHGVDVTAGKFTCYQGGVRIPYTMKWKGHIQPGTTCDALMQNADFIPTLLEAVGLPLPESLKIDGLSHWKQMTGGADNRDDMYFEWGYARAVRTKKYKYIAYRPTREQIESMKTGKVNCAYNLSGRLRSQTVMRNYPHYFVPDQLYDLESDPREQTNLANNPQYEDILNDMKARLKRYLDNFAHPFDLAVAPFLTSDAYDALVKETLQDDRIYKTYWFLQHAY